MPGKDIKMNYHNGFEVNLVEKQITLTKKFARRVSDMNSPEYATFMRLRTVYPQFAIVKYTIEQKAKREKYGKLNYERMAALIAEWEAGNAGALAEFEQKKREAACCNGSYGIVKKWFLEKYRSQYCALKGNASENV